MLVGIIQDPQGQIMPFASVQWYDSYTETYRGTSANADGVFAVPDTTTGDITITRGGCQPIIIESSDLSPNVQDAKVYRFLNCHTSLSDVTISECRKVNFDVSGIFNIFRKRDKLKGRDCFHGAGLFFLVLILLLLIAGVLKGLGRRGRKSYKAGGKTYGIKGESQERQKLAENKETIKKLDKIINEEIPDTDEGFRRYDKASKLKEKLELENLGLEDKLYQYAKGGSVYSKDPELQRLYEIYSKDTLNNLSKADDEFIDDYIEDGGGDDIKEIIDHIMYSKLEKEYPAYYKKITADDYDLEPIIWRYTDHNLQNGLSGKENYDEFIEYLKEEDETFAKAYDYPLPFAKGGMYSGIKEGKKVEIADYYIKDEVGQRAKATPTAIILSEPSDDEELVMVQYTNGSIDYVPQDVIEVLPFAKGGKTPKVYDVGYTTDSGESFVAVNISAKSPTEAKSKIKKRVPKVSKFYAVFPHGKIQQYNKGGITYPKWLGRYQYPTGVMYVDKSGGLKDYKTIAFVFDEPQQRYIKAKNKYENYRVAVYSRKPAHKSLIAQLKKEYDTSKGFLKSVPYAKGGKSKPRLKKGDNE